MCFTISKINTYETCSASHPGCRRTRRHPTPLGDHAGKGSLKRPEKSPHLHLAGIPGHRRRAGTFHPVGSTQRPIPIPHPGIGLFVSLLIPYPALQQILDDPLQQLVGLLLAAVGRYYYCGQRGVIAVADRDIHRKIGVFPVKEGIFPG